MTLRFHSLLACGIALTLSAGDTVRAQTNLSDCAEIGDADERLACYDRAAEDSRNLPVFRLPRSNTPQQTDSGASQQETVRAGDNFGQESRGGDERGSDTRTYLVAAARHNKFTGWTIEFESGGVWKQVGTDDYDIEVGERYTIRRATFSSFMLSNPNNNRKIRVTRVE